MKIKPFNEDKTYWNSCGTYQLMADKLIKLIPSSGPVQGKQIRNLEKMRRIMNCYYDLLNNGGYNLYSSIVRYAGCGTGGYKGDNTECWKALEEKLNELIPVAFEEQIKAGRIKLEESK